jgi:DNA gyrase/topoisomerase IV subunit A
MITPEKIEEWIKEVEQRPGSAPIIMQYLAHRLQELTAQNEKLLAENILLETGKRVEEYESRIAYLDYQLSLLKRHFGSEEVEVERPEIEGQIRLDKSESSIQILVFDLLGRILRIMVPQAAYQDGAVGRVLVEKEWKSEPPRLAAVPANEELLIGFTSGRIAVLPVTSIPPAPIEAYSETGLNWKEAPIPEEMNPNENLACILPISKMALADSFIQISRKGFVKKIRASMAESILSHRYIGTGVYQPVDKMFEILLGRKNDRIVLVSSEGYLQCIDEKLISPSTEEVIHLGIADHLVSGFIANPDDSILLMTQIGKSVQKNFMDLDTPPSLKTKGQSVISQQRRAKGVRFVSARSTRESDWGICLDREGKLSLFSVKEILNTGVLPIESEVYAFTTFRVQES